MGRFFLCHECNYLNNIFADLKYNKPFLVTYINTATFSLYLLPFIFNRKKKKEPTNDVNLEIEARLLDENNIPNSAEDLTFNDSVILPEPQLTTIETIKLSLAFCILWFFANYTTNASLAYTSVASSTILSSMSGLFTLGKKSFIGIVFVSYSDQLTRHGQSTLPSPLVGDLLALCGAIFYGCYTTLLKLKIGDESRINMPLFFGFVGAFNLLLLWPAFPILHSLHVEKFELPYSPSLWIMVLLNAFIGTFLSDYLWLLSMLMTSPLVVTLGISLTIPLALVGDVVFKHFMPGIQYAIGATLVVAGFLIVNIMTLSDVEEKARSIINDDDNYDVNEDEGTIESNFINPSGANATSTLGSQS
ncbi:MAG: hypothetical protein EXX96DRAFT_593613 [Benjaminiella poitrasii]|nr:MAG: hypothetical protein EXX96DRAFT_593613 [Benjaminiella poitrasii]